MSRIITLNPTDDTCFVSMSRQDKPLQAPSQGEQTGAQSKQVGTLPGSSLMEFPGFGPSLAGTYDLYRRISAHPTVALTIESAISPILSAEWVWKKKDGVPQAWLDLMQDMFDPYRHEYVRNGLKGLEFGSAAFERVWEERSGFQWLTRNKPLAPECTEILVDKGGNFVGLRNSPKQGEKVDLIGAKAWLYTYDNQFGNLYGRSRHENIRDDFSKAIQIADRLAQYLKKIAGIVVQLHFPDGTSKDASGADRPNDWLAQGILDAVSAGKSVRFPNLFATLANSDPLRAADLAGKSQWVLSALDVGGTDYAPGLIAALEYLDKRFVRGWLRPERSLLEAQRSGSRADSKTHGDVGTIDSELISRDYAFAFAKGNVDVALELNFGIKARGAVWPEPEPINDDTAQNKMDVIKAMLADPNTGPGLAAKIDDDELLDSLDIPVREGMEDMPLSDFVQLPPMLGKPGVNPTQNGNGHPQPDPLARRNGN